MRSHQVPNAARRNGLQKAAIQGQNLAINDFQVHVSHTKTELRADPQVLHASARTPWTMSISSPARSAGTPRSDLNLPSFSHELWPVCASPGLPVSISDGMYAMDTAFTRHFRSARPQSVARILVSWTHAAFVVCPWRQWRPVKCGLGHVVGVLPILRFADHAADADPPSEGLKLVGKTHLAFSMTDATKLGDTVPAALCRSGKNAAAV
jgi:hypothetical protein